MKKPKERRRVMMIAPAIMTMRRTAPMLYAELRPVVMEVAAPEKEVLLRSTASTTPEEMARPM